MDEKATTIHCFKNEIMDGVIELTGNIYSECTGKFIFKSFRGKICIMLMYYYDINYILIEAKKTVKDNQSSIHMKRYTKT